MNLFGRFNKLIGISIIVLTLLIIIPSSFALNETDISAGNSTDVASENALQSTDDDVLSGVYYFDSSNYYKGDGSQDNPYRELTSNRIKDSSTLYFASGEYNLSFSLDAYHQPSKKVKDVTIIGENAETTIIRCTSTDTGIFQIVNGNYLSLENVTIVGFNFDLDGGKLYAENTIFRDTVGPYEESEATNLVDSAFNSMGGVIFGYTYLYDTYPRIYIDNCTFINNTAEYGGAIFADDSIVVIRDSRFFDNHAYNYGGTLVFSGDTLVIVNDTTIVNSNSLKNVGGAIYIEMSDFESNNLTVINCSSTFGGAITSLNSTTKLNKFIAVNNSASYDGGAIYQMYNSISITDSEFINNTARNGGAIFVDDVSKFELAYNNFNDNYGSIVTNSVYAMYSHSTINKNNVFSRKDSSDDGIYENNQISLVIGDGNYTIFYDDSTVSGALPSRYSSVEQGYVTPVTSQGTGGNCWAFAAIAALESSILKASGQSLDLSEGNMKNIMALFSDYGWDSETNEGGNDNVAIGYLASWLGPVYEYQDEYDDFDMLSPVLNSLTHVQNIIFIYRQSFTDNDEIKEAIMKYGAVVSGIYFDDDSYSESHYSHYYSDSPHSNHAITIVGWDDSYSRNNFLEKTCRQWGMDCKEQLGYRLGR